MRGVGEATSAITVVNALSCGVGAAVGIALSTRATVELASNGAGGIAKAGPSVAAGATRVVRAALAFAIGRFAPGGSVPVHLEITSSVPVGVGLKSSSAVASAVVRAVANAVGRSPTAAEVAALAAEAGRASGVSATGAYDDALAGLVDGVVVTDNRRDRLLERRPLDPGLAVALWIPSGTHPSVPSVAQRFWADGDAGRSAAEAARSGRFWEAMSENSEIVERAMGYSYRPLRQRLLEHGALGAGTSGLGPALAAVGPRERIGTLLGMFPRGQGRAIAVEFSRSGSGGGLP